MIGRSGSHHATDFDMIQDLGMLAPLSLVRLARLAFFVRCVRSPHPPTCCIVHVKGSPKVLDYYRKK
eukprot:314181-Karenia_brevis.AAC.1